MEFGTNNNLASAYSQLTPTKSTTTTNNPNSRVNSPSTNNNNNASSPNSLHTVKPPFGTDLSYESPSSRRKTEITRNPITEGDDFDIKRGKKLVPDFVGDIAGLSSAPREGHGKGRPAVTIDRTRAGLPTDLRRARVRDGDLFILRARPNSAPASTSFKDSNTPAGITPPQRVRKVKEVPGSVTRRNPLVDNDDTTRRPPQPLEFSVTKESSRELWDTKKTPRKLLPTHRPKPVANQGVVPFQDPSPIRVKISAFMPDDNKDVFEYKHSQGISLPTDLLFKQREQEKETYEKTLRDSSVEKMEFYKQVKERMVRKNPALKESLFPTKKLDGSQTP